jgi:hypothetical protein
MMVCRWNGRLESDPLELHPGALFYYNYVSNVSGGHGYYSERIVAGAHGHHGMHVGFIVSIEKVTWYGKPVSRPEPPPFFNVVAIIETGLHEGELIFIPEGK